jgi:hypothetical protein
MGKVQKPSNSEKVYSLTVSTVCVGLYTRFFREMKRFDLNCTHNKNYTAPIQAKIAFLREPIVACTCNIVSLTMITLLRFGRYRIHISNRRPAILTEISRGYPHSIRENTERERAQIRTPRLPSTSFPSHHSLHIQSYWQHTIDQRWSRC